MLNDLRIAAAKIETFSPPVKEVSYSQQEGSKDIDLSLSLKIKVKL